MILTTMAYALCVAGLLALFAWVTEHVCAELGRARRWVWVFAMTASLTMPAYVLLAPAGGTDARLFALPFTIDFVPDVLPESAGTSTSGAGDSGWRRPSTWVRPLTSRTADNLLLGLWAASSMLASLALGLAIFCMSRSVRRFERRTIDGASVLLADRLGPAVVGFVAPRIILPRWLANGDRTLLALVLAHERAHIRARDQVLLLFALALVAAMPWNVALWWQLRRLRAAIEVDCDSRVLRDGTDASAYSRALLSVRLGGASTPVGAVALTEPVSDLERRITIMLEENRAFSLSRVGVRSALALTVLGIALAVNAPRAQQSDAPQSAEPSRRGLVMRESVYELLSKAQSCIGEDQDVECAREAVEQASRIADLNAYEKAQLWYFRAFVDFNAGNVPAAILNYENVLRLTDVPEPQRQSTLFALAQLYAHNEQNERALETLNEWFERVQAPGAAASFGERSGQAYAMRSMLEYRLGRHEAALQAVNTAIERAPEPVEDWYTLRLAIQLEQGDRAGAIETLERLNSRWPSPERAQQLAALRGGEQ